MIYLIFKQKVINGEKRNLSRSPGDLPLEARSCRLIGAKPTAYPGSFRE